MIPARLKKTDILVGDAAGYITSLKIFSAQIFSTKCHEKYSNIKKHLPNSVIVILKYVTEITFGGENYVA